MRKYEFLAVSLLVIILLVPVSCSRDEITGSATGKIDMELILPRGALVEEIDLVTLAVLGAEEFTYYDTTEVLGFAFFFPTFELPAGTATFNVEALDNMQVVYTGERTVSIIPGINNPVVINVEATQSYPVTGIVSNAQNGLPIAGAEVILDNDTRLTNDLGVYLFEQVLPGSHSMIVSKEGFISNEKSVVVGNAPLNVNFVLTEQLGAEEWRLVLTWGAAPLDMDLHLWSGATHIYFGNLGSPDSEPFITLDTDDQTGFGPETITITQLDQLCHIVVHNYSGEPEIKSSEANLEVYNGEVRVKTYTIPATGEGRWWYVCDLSASASLIDQDYLTNTLPFEVGKVSSIAIPK
jgi:hypothetical protein